MFNRRLTYIAVAAIALATGSTFAVADPHDRGWHGDHHRFHDDDHGHGGHWYHGDHDGHFGWWWIAAGMWYLYPAPVYPYPSVYEPPVVVVEPEPEPIINAPPSREPVWYYCKSARNYYPYASVCPEGWRIVPAQPSDVDER